MTRKHFNDIAQRLAEVMPAEKTKQWDGWFGAVCAIADSCQKFNSRFDRNKFLDACKDWDSN